jgi:hypothetical protein
MHGSKSKRKGLVVVNNMINKDNEEIKRALRFALSDRTTTEKVFAMYKQNIHDQLVRIETAETWVSDNPNLMAISAATKRMYQDMGVLMDVIEANALNTVDLKDILLQLVDASRQSDKRKEETQARLETKVRQQENEINEFKKHMPYLEWLANYFKKSGETSQA